MEDINNLAVYNSGMAKSLSDKLFFLPILVVGIVIYFIIDCAMYESEKKK